MNKSKQKNTFDFSRENLTLSKGIFFYLHKNKMIYYALWGLVVGGLLGYLVFYLRYQYRDTVNELRSYLKEANQQIQYLQEELEEFTMQNEILKEKTTELLAKNDELSDVVAELSKYYVHIKRASEKTEELSKYLTEPDEEVEEKIMKQLKKEPVEKKFF